MSIETNFDIIGEGKSFPTMDMMTRNAKYRLNESRLKGTYGDGKYLIIKDVKVTTDEEFEAYLAECKSTSNYVTSPGVDRNSKIVSLSTCTNVNEDERFLLQGVLIKEE